MQEQSDDYLKINDKAQQRNKKFNEITQNILKNVFTSKKVDFEIEFELEPNEVQQKSITDSIIKGTLINQRMGDTIYYKEVTYNEIVAYRTDSNEFVGGETKIALLWTKNRMDKVAKEDVFILQTLDDPNTWVRKIPSSFLNPSFRKEIVVLRDTYINMYTIGTPETQSITILGDPATKLVNHNVGLSSDEIKSTYYSNSNKETPMYSTFNSNSQTISQGDLYFLVMSSSTAITQYIKITGQLVFY